MADEKSTGRPLDATGTTVRKNIRWIRDERGISASDLSDQLKILGRPIPPLGISRIENGQRRVDVDDLVAIAIALRVSPATLLMPLRKDDGSKVDLDDVVPVAGWHQPISARPVWEWLTGEEPLFHGSDLERMQFGEHAWPLWKYREEAELYEELRRRLYEQGKNELTGKTRRRRRASELLAELRAEGQEAGADGDD